MNGCWIWRGNIHKKSNKHGKDYNGKWDCGRFYLGRIYMKAYHAAWILYKGNLDLNDEVVVRHTCDNSLCVNPEHLLLGTSQENTLDSVERGRNVQGIRVWKSKLNEENVKEILERVRSGEKLKDIAQIFNVSMGAISLIKNGYNWKQVSQNYAP